MKDCILLFHGDRGIEHRGKHRFSLAMIRDMRAMWVGGRERRYTFGVIVL